MKNNGEENSKPLQYFFLENSMDRGAWQATVHGVTKSRTRLNDYHHYSRKNKICMRSENTLL